MSLPFATRRGAQRSTRHGEAATEWLLKLGQQLPAVQALLQSGVVFRASLAQQWQEPSQISVNDMMAGRNQGKLAWFVNHMEAVLPQPHYETLPPRLAPLLPNTNALAQPKLPQGAGD